MQKLILMGAQGSGKGTQAKLLERELDLVHISVGDILRWHIQSRTKLGGRVQSLVSAGQLVPDEMVIDLVHRRLDDHDWNFGFVLDGFPRNEEQARFFLTTYDVDAVVLLDVPIQVVTQRMLARRVCSRCGRDWNLVSQRPAVPETCDSCGGSLIAREDDRPDAIRERLADYRAKTEPILDLFRTKERVLTIDGTLPPDEVHHQIRGGLGL